MALNWKDAPPEDCNKSKNVVVFVQSVMLFHPPTPPFFFFFFCYHNHRVVLVLGAIVEFDWFQREQKTQKQIKTFSFCLVGWPCKLCESENIYLGPTCLQSRPTAEILGPKKEKRKKKNFLRMGPQRHRDAFVTLNITFNVFLYQPMPWGNYTSRIDENLVNNNKQHA